MKAVIVAISALFAIAAGDARRASQVDSVLAANRAASGAVPEAGTIELRYRTMSAGLAGAGVLRYDLASGAYAEEQDAQGVHTSDGFDGKVPWQQDISLAYTPQRGGDRPDTAASMAYRHANLWWRAGRDGAKIVHAGNDTIAGRRQDHLLVMLKQGHRIDAWFDADTHLLTRIAEMRQFFHTTETYSDYRAESGVMLAHEIVVDPGLGPDGVSTSTLQGVSLKTARPLLDYAMPAMPPTGATIVGGVSATTVPFRLLNNHIYVQAQVNGKGPYTFLVDTGGHTLLSHGLVRELGLKIVGASVESGAGESHQTAGFVHFDEIAIGNARLRDETGTAADIYDPSIEGIRVDGMIGFEMIRRLVTTIDYGARTLTFTEPSAFRPRRALGTAVPFMFYDHLPNVRGSLLGMVAGFDIDTGSRSEVDITSPFVSTNHLRGRFAKGTSTVTGWGVGGPARGYVVRLPRLVLGSVPVVNVVAGLSEARAGSMSDPAFAGNIGSGLLKRFVVTFDYARQVMYLRRIEPMPGDVGTFNRSGLWINARDEGYEVTDVASGSPGSIAGVKIGDMVTAIDGKPTHAEDLSDARRLFRERPAGTKVQLSIRRQDEKRTAILILKDQI